MLNGISCANFKSLKNLNAVKVKPITILCGANSCGKSSLLESILLLKQTARNMNSANGIVFNGDYVHLGDFENVVSAHNPESDIELTYSFTLNTSSKRLLRIFRSLLGYSGHQTNKQDSFPYRLKVSVTISKFGKGHYIKKYRLELSYESTSAFCELENNPQHSERGYRRKDLLDLKTYLITCDLGLSRSHLPVNNEASRLTISKADNFSCLVNFNGLFPSASDVYSGIISYEFKRNIDRYSLVSLADFLDATQTALVEICQNTRYLGPLREAPARRYFYDDVVTDIGVKGENAAYLLLNEGNTEKLYPLPEGRSAKTSLSDATQEWLEYMGIQGLHVRNDKDIYRVVLSDTNTQSVSVNIADVGFGISQVFPIILEGLRMPKHSTLILEQPEIHLHPKLQMQLSDYMIAMAQQDKGFVVETHSDHIINRLVRRIVEDETGRLANLIQIYFVSPTHDGAHFHSIEIDDTRGIVNWPEGFFDQTANEQEMILRAGLKKRKARREKFQQNILNNHPSDY